MTRAYGGQNKSTRLLQVCKIEVTIVRTLLQIIMIPISLTIVKVNLIIFKKLSQNIIPTGCVSEAINILVRSSYLNRIVHYESDDLIIFYTLIYGYIKRKPLHMYGVLWLIRLSSCQWQGEGILNLLIKSSVALLSIF